MIGPVVRRISSSIFVGRVVERAQLEAGLDEAGRSDPGLVLLGGEAGIGKTRLVSELTTMAGSRGALVVRGHCLDAKAASMPFAPFIEILRGLLLGQPAPADVGADEPGRSALYRLVPEIEPQPASERRSATEDERVRLFYAVLGLFGRTSMDRSLVVVIEDLHWADASSLDLLKFIAGRLSDERLLVLGTFRTDELHRRHPLVPLLGEFVRLPHVMRLDLPAFTQPEVADQLTGIAGSRPADDVVERVFARSDGNPFFVEELAGHDADARLPATLRDVLAARLAALSPDARAVVLAAAAIGHEASHALIAQVAALPQDQLSIALREAIDYHVLVPADPRSPAGFAFRHALIQEIAYTELLPSERVAVHRTIAKSLQEAGGSSGEIARHALLSHDLPTGLVESVAAAEQAFGALAFAESLAHLERALEVWSEVSEPESLTGRDQASTLMLAARCAEALGRWRRAADLGRAALAQLNPIERRDERIGVLLELARWEFSADDEVARAAAIREAAALIPPDAPTALLARLLTERAHMAHDNGRVDEARILAEEAIETSRAVGARAEEAGALVRLADILAGLMQPATAEILLAEAELIAVDLDDLPDSVIGRLVHRQADFATMMGAFARAIEIVDTGLLHAERTGRFGERSGFLRPLKILGLACLGRWDEAEALAVEARRDASVSAARAATEMFVEVLVRQGRIAEAAAATSATDFGYESPLGGSWTLQTRIIVAHGDGRFDDARAAADELISLFEDPARDVNVISVLERCVGIEADRAELAHRRRKKAEEEEARRVGLAHLALVLPSVQEAIELGGTGPLIEAELATAVAEGTRLEGRSDAQGWADVARRRVMLAQPWETAYARFRQAEAILVSRGGKQEVQPPLSDAHRIAQQLGATPLVEQIERLARHGRVRLATVPAERRTRRATTPEGVIVALTTREWEVLTMVAAGHTNREIGEELFISEKTASVHISNAMDKLGALSRYDAAAIATRVGLLDVTRAGVRSTTTGSARTSRKN
jgi:DNA-binding CsgD family transcriptional regulator/tetratricopeptide (TPR) repeat protein